MRKLSIASVASFCVLFLGGILAIEADADMSDTAKQNVGKAVIKFENDLIDADIDKAPLGVVVEQIEDQTGAYFVVKDASILNYPLSIKIEEVELEQALKRIFKHYSYVTYYDSEGYVDRVVIFGAKAGAVKAIARPAVGSQTSPSSSGSSFSASTEESTQIPVRQGDAPQTSSTSKQTEAGTKSVAEAEKTPEELEPDTADIPYDLDDYQPLSDDLADAGIDNSQTEPEDPEGMRLAAEEQAAREARLNQQRLERSLSALDSEHAHLRSMAVDELVGVRDPRATTALANTASSKKNSSHERRQAAQALWHQAADYQFADSTANSALEQLANDSDPEVRNIARRALKDMERYKRRYNRP